MSDDVESEERAIYAIVAAAVSPVVVGVLLDGSTIDGGGALSMLLAITALVGLVAGVRRMTRSRLPVARVHRER